MKYVLVCQQDFDISVQLDVINGGVTGHDLQRLLFARIPQLTDLRMVVEAVVIEGDLRA